MNKGTLIAVGVFGALLAAVLLTREEKVSEGIPTFAWKTIEQSQVTKIEVSGAKTASLVKGPDGWKVFDPAHPEVTHAADGPLVDGVLHELNAFKAGDHVTSKVERQAELEIDDAKGLKIVASGEQGVLGALVVGKRSKTGGAYVRLPDHAEVFTTPSNLSWVARKDVSGFRKKTVVGLKLDDVVALNVRTGESDFALAPADGGWALTSPVPKDFRFDSSIAQRLAQQLAGLSAQDFAADGGMATDGAQLTATLKDGTSKTVHLGAAEGGTVPVRVDGDPQVYLVSPVVASQLSRKLDDLRDLSLFSFDPEKVTRLTLTLDGKKVVAVKDGGAWKVTEPKVLPAGLDFDSNQVQGVVGQLRYLHGLRVDASQDAQRACKGKPVVAVEVALDDKSTRTLRFGADLSEKEVCAMGSNDALTYAVSKAELTRLQTGVELFKRPPPAPQGQPGGVRGLEDLPPEIRAQFEAQLRQRQMQQQKP